MLVTAKEEWKHNKKESIRTQDLHKKGTSSVTHGHTLTRHDGFDMFASCIIFLLFLQKKMLLGNFLKKCSYFIKTHREQVLNTKTIYLKILKSKFINKLKDS